MSARALAIPRPASSASIRFGHLLAAAVVPVVTVAGQGKRDELAALQFRDPDDALRLVEVRDWRAGQSWFDVSQHRVAWTSGGGDMHWSRLIDVPVALVQRTAEAFTDPAQAERIALVVVPLATLAIALMLLGLIARRLIGDGGALLSVLLVIPTITVLRQFEPLRIDHHAWQIVAALAIVLGVLARRQAVAGAAAAGMAGAVWLAISIEGLPFVAAALGLLGLRFATHAEAAPLRAFATTFALGCLGLSALAHGSAMWGKTQCDALSMAYLPSFAVFAVAVVLVSITARGSALMRWTGLALTGLAAGAVLVAGSTACADGPFGTFDPLVRRFWYARVDEGLPIWRQELIPAVATILVPLIGLAGSIAAWRRADSAQARDWCTATTMLAAALAVALFVNRFDAIAILLALPGIAASVASIRRSAWQRDLPRRALANVAIVLLVLPMPLFGLALAAFGPGVRGELIQCILPHEIAALNQLPRGARLFAPLDIGPAILVGTSHQVLATGHHRNAAAMRDVIAAFSGASENARRIVAGNRTQYVVTCANMREMDHYREAAPRGFASDLSQGRVPAWLEPVALRGSSLSVWRVR